MISEPASSPTISGSGAVTQQGTGITVLTGNNSYGGSTAVDAGTLIVNGNQSAAAGATSVAAGATLGGAGTIGGDVSVADGATLSPGNLGSVPGTLRDLLYRQAAVRSMKHHINAIRAGEWDEASGRTAYEASLRSEEAGRRLAELAVR